MTPSGCFSPRLRVFLACYVCGLGTAASGQHPAQEQGGADAPQAHELASDYLPRDAFSDLERQWYTEQLTAMKERPLTEAADDTSSREAYRFLWLRTFDHPIAVRIEKDPNRVVVKELDGKGGYKPGALILDKSRPLTDKEWAEVARRIESCGFWSMPSTEDRSFPAENGFARSWSMTDGAQWIVEGVREGEYHVVDRQSPDESTHRKLAEYRSLCLHRLGVAGFDLEAMKVY